MAQSYQEIVSILEEAVSSDEIGAHRNFWRTLTRNEFVAFKVFGSIPLVVRSETGTGFDAAESNLIKALEARTPFGRDVGVAGANFRRMPAGRPALAQDQIDRIRTWLEAGAPE